MDMGVILIDYAAAAATTFWAASAMVSALMIGSPESASSFLPSSSLVPFIRTTSGPLRFTARQAAEKVYGFKVLVDEETDLILGAHLVGPHADEVINLFALAIRQGITAEQLETTMFAYPTGASDIGYML